MNRDMPSRRVMRRFGDLADDIARRLPDREGLVFGDRRYTFRQIA